MITKDADRRRTSIRNFQDQSRATSSTKTKKRLQLTALLLTVVLAMFSVQQVSAATSEVVGRGSPAHNKIALTFDYESSSGLTSILSTLEAYNVRSTFFITGDAAALNPQGAPAIQAGGHEIANHSYTHRDFTALSHEEMLADLRQAEEVIRAQTGSAPLPYFRPPYGAYNHAVLNAAAAAGYSRTLMWSVDTLDWQSPEPAVLNSRVFQEAHNGAIVLMHVSQTSTAEQALPDMIQGLHDRGYELVTVSELLGLSGDLQHTVQAGDTLWGIANMYGVTVDAIIEANAIMNPEAIHVGQVFVIPGAEDPAPSPEPVRHHVEPGDTLWGIANRYGVTVDAIIEANAIMNPEAIHVGQIFVIPGAEEKDAEPLRHTVRAGETLWGIGVRYSVTVDAIIALNNIANPDHISVGQIFEIPPAVQVLAAPSAVQLTRHEVTAGDTIWGVAQQYGLPHEAVLNANKLENPDLIYEEMDLLIPDNVAPYLRDTP